MTFHPNYCIQYINRIPMAETETCQYQQDIKQGQRTDVLKALGSSLINL